MWQHSSSGCSLPGTRPSINHSSSISAVFAGARSSSSQLFGSYKWRQTVQINNNQQGTHKHSGLKKVLEKSFHQDSRKVMVLIILFPKEFSEILLSLLLISTVSCCQVTPWEGHMGLRNTENRLHATCLGKVTTWRRHSKLSVSTLMCCFLYFGLLNS